MSNQSLKSNARTWLKNIVDSIPDLQARELSDVKPHLKAMATKKLAWIADNDLVKLYKALDNGSVQAESRAKALRVFYGRLFVDKLETSQSRREEQLNASLELRIQKKAFKALNRIGTVTRLWIDNGEPMVSIVEVDNGTPCSVCDLLALNVGSVLIDIQKTEAKATA